MVILNRELDKIHSEKPPVRAPSSVVYNAPREYPSLFETFTSSATPNAAKYDSAKGSVIVEAGKVLFDPDISDEDKYSQLESMSIAIPDDIQVLIDDDSISVSEKISHIKDYALLNF